MSQLELTPYENLIQDCQTLSLEAFTLNDMKKAIDNTLPRLSANFMDTLRSMTRWDHSRPETLNVSALRMKARRMDYLDMDEVLIPVPMGFNGDLTTYTKHLDTVVLPNMALVNTRILKQVMALLSRYVNEPEQFEERRLMELGVDDRKAIDDLARSEGEFYVSGNRTSDVPYTRVFQSNSEMVATAETINAINQKRWKLANPKDVEKQVHSMGQIATVLFEQIQQREEAPSKEHMRLIADSLELAARWVEWYSAMTTRVIELTGTMKRTEQKLVRL